MACPTYRIDSDDVGLRVAIEDCLKVLPTSPTWYPLEPNSFGDFGASISQTARSPINPSRQGRKGVITDLDASANFQVDALSRDSKRFIKGFLFSAYDYWPTSAPEDETAIQIGTVSGTDKSITLPSALKNVNHLVPGTAAYSNALFRFSGFANAANNGLKTVNAEETVLTKIVVWESLVDEANPPPEAKIQQVGMSMGIGLCNISVANGVVRLNSSSFNLYITLKPGDWIYLGGGISQTNNFANNKGFARIKSIDSSGFVLDKCSWMPVTEAGTGKNIQIIFANSVYNRATNALSTKYAYQFERTVGSDNDGLMGQYVIGNIANQMTINLTNSDKVTIDYEFVGCDSEARSGAAGLKPGFRPALTADNEAYNAASDLKRLAFTIVGETSPLFVYSTDLTLTINNNATGAKALGTLGNFDINVGTFELTGSVTAYFQDVRAINAVRNNTDVSFDMIMVKNQTAVIYDIPLMSLSNGMLNIEQGEAITIPLDMSAYQSNFGWTISYNYFPYLPADA